MLLVRPDFTEMTVLGAAIAAGLAANVWKDTSQLPRATPDIYEPQIQPDGRYAIASVCNDLTSPMEIPRLSLHIYTYSHRGLL